MEQEESKKSKPGKSIFGVAPGEFKEIPKGEQKVPDEADGNRVNGAYIDYNQEFDEVENQMVKIPTNLDEIDRLLSRYVSGVATKEEERQALAYIASSKENMIAFDIVCAAAEYQQEAESKQQQILMQEHKRILQRRFLWVASSIAVAVLVCLVVFSILRAGN